MLLPFNAEQLETFKRLEKALIEPAILSVPKPYLPFGIDIDVCHYQDGVVLLKPTRTGSTQSRILEPWSQ